MWPVSQQRVHTLVPKPTCPRPCFHTPLKPPAASLVREPLDSERERSRDGSWKKKTEADSRSNTKQRQLPEGFILRSALDVHSTCLFKKLVQNFKEYGCVFSWWFQVENNVQAT